MASGRQAAGGSAGGSDKSDKNVLDAAGAVAKLWLETEGSTGHKELDNALQRLAVAYRDWVGHQPDQSPSAST